ncbi:SusC/RagA family TonB-linked outer membrane protein [Pedobacter miscanthi]|uniref:SusC/RagA family TonB-linked outer membrane protein n=1 Tax=Pedobacter miscanthi TaxID=2259170 RepID=A0A366KYZ4_9SPHI|nr:SusC/RagA family TonB-linked outer membrane protein [Pedobacter miscanthi]RBQ06808.1 SusC/RagA family TonB-linked outer membrane protein [Pedobacter miscanthi]
MNKLILLIVLATLCPNLKLSAQTSTQISGRVLASDDGNPLPGATISIKNSNTAVQSAKDGSFTIQTETATGTLIISYTGYKSQQISFNGPINNLKISMEESHEAFDDIQVIGYGKTTKRLNTGSVSSISAKQIQQQPVGNVVAALSGRMPGVFIQTANGLPGGNINIQIRGKGSIVAGTDPLYIVDGVPFDGTPIGKGNTDVINIAGAVSPLSNLNPADIENITILKDADATSIYGSRGANGVVLITTKKAKSGATKIDVNLRQGISTISAKPKLLNLQDYLQMRKNAFSNDKLIPSSDPASTSYAPDLTLWSQTQSTDWVDYIFGSSASSTDLQARVSGGKGNTTFSVNGNFRNEGTVLPGNNSYYRTGLSSDIQHFSENQKFSIRISNQLSRQQSDLSNIVNNIDRSFLIAPNYPLTLPDGSINWYAGNIDAESLARSKNTTDNSITSAELAYRFLPNLSFKVNSGYTKSSYDQTFISPSSSLPPGSINSTNFTKSSTQSFITEPQLDYNLNFGRHKLSFLVGATYQHKSSERMSVIASNFSLESLMENPGSAGTVASTGSDSQYKYASLFSRITYNLKDTYILNATLRRDGSSRFGPGNRYGNFGSIGASWIFSNQNWVREKLPVLSLGKLRASLGTSGNDQIPDYGYLSTFSSPGSAVYQGTAIIRPSRISNADFKWENTRKMDLGVELGFFKDALSLIADYYRSSSSDQLVNYAIPLITGFSSYQANLPAVIQNSGWEISVNSNNLKGKKIAWSTNFNITIPENKLKSFDNFENSSYAAIYELGYDITRIRGYQSLGIDPASGKVLYAGRDGQASAAPYSNFTLGKTAPDFYGGLGNTISYQNFEFSVFLQFVKQRTKGGINRNPGGGGTFNEFDLEPWSLSNPSSTVPPPSTQFDFYYGQSSANIFDTSYLRLKNVSLSYLLPAEAAKKMGLTTLRIFAEGQNLYTWWHHNSAVMDPESGAISTTTGRNIPPLKTFVMGLQISL